MKGSRDSEKAVMLQCQHSYEENEECMDLKYFG